MLLTMRDKQRIEVVQAVMDGRINVNEAGTVLKRSIRQIYRLLKKLRTHGLSGLIHGNRGRMSPCRTPETVREKILRLVRGKYRDINDTHLKEILDRDQGVSISRPTLRVILRSAGIPAKRKRRPLKYRSRRVRKEAFGMMLQIDASGHDWLEERGPWLTLVSAKDDATGFAWARFVMAETTWAYLDLMRRVALNHGLPLSLYSDRHSIFHPTREPTLAEQLQNKMPLTQFGRAMDELGISIIPAYSPQAKGRIERLFGVLQDRLVVELRLAGAKTLEQANVVLETFLKSYNKRFSVHPKNTTSMFRTAPPLKSLDRVLCLKDTRIVNKDHTVSFDSLILQIPPSKKFHSLASQKIQILQLKDGSIEMVYRDQTVARFTEEAIKRMLKLNLHKRTSLESAA